MYLYMQGELLKKSMKGLSLTRDWKFKFVVLYDDGRLAYFTSQSVCCVRE